MFLTSLLLLSCFFVALIIKRIVYIVLAVRAAEGSEMIHKKKTIRLQRTSDEEIKKQKHRACFWTPPWGHTWGTTGHGYSDKCQVCGKKSRWR